MSERTAAAPEPDVTRDASSGHDRPSPERTVPEALGGLVGAGRAVTASSLRPRALLAVQLAAGNAAAVAMRSRATRGAPPPIQRTPPDGGVDLDRPPDRDEARTPEEVDASLPAPPDAPPVPPHPDPPHPDPPPQASQPPDGNGTLEPSPEDGAAEPPRLQERGTGQDGEEDVDDPGGAAGTSAPASIPREEQEHQRPIPAPAPGDSAGSGSAESTPTEPPASTPVEAWGDPGSSLRRQRVNDLLVAGLTGGAKDGALMGGAVTVVSMLATSQASRMLAARGVSQAAKAAGPVGAVISGGVAVFALATKDWEQSAAIRARWNQGEGDELTANRLSASAEWLDIIGNVVDIVGGLAGIAALACTGLAFLTAGATAPAAAFLGKVALGAGIASLVMGVIKTILLGLALYYRRKHLLEMGLEDVDALEAQGSALRDDAQGVGGFMGGMAAAGGVGGGKWLTGRGARGLGGIRTRRAAERGVFLDPPPPRDAPTVSAKARQRLAEVAGPETSGTRRAEGTLRGAERLDTELGGTLPPPRPQTPDGTPSRGGPAPEARDPAARPPRSPDGRPPEPPGRIPGDERASVPTEPAGGPTPSRGALSPAEGSRRLGFIEGQRDREISFWGRVRDSARRGNDEGHAATMRALDRSEQARVGLVDRWAARQRERAGQQPDAPERLQQIEAEATTRKASERQWAEDRRAEARERHGTRQREIDQRYQNREADARVKAERAMQETRDRVIQPEQDAAAPPTPRPPAGADASEGGATADGVGSATPGRSRAAASREVASFVATTGLAGQSAGGAFDGLVREGRLDWSRVLSSFPLAADGVAALVEIVFPPPPAPPMGDFPVPPADAPVMASPDEGREVVEPVRPPYPAPPSSSLELQQIEIELGQLEDAQLQAAGQQQEAQEEIEARTADQARLEQAKAGADRGAETSQEVGTTLGERSRTHQQAEQELEGAQGEAGRYERESGKLGTFVSLVRGIGRFASILTIRVMPNRAQRAGRSMMERSAEIVGAIEDTNRDMRTERTTAPQKRAIMDSRAEQIGGASQQAPETQQDFEQTSDDLQAIADATAERRSEAQEVATGNREAESAARARMAQLQAQRAERTAAMERWAEEHREARIEAIQETRDRLEAQDHDITSVTGDD
ncbi:hypothetical protein [Nitriliruptor alkaliphilus]|uniref:hypothetical protein n=1 Tax=Nitriliruptor alkaliphilus TaxID=427918 RepID=UPI0006976D91|nr:hypothetical protein [Nitriliruptor alkaliphilus]